MVEMETAAWGPLGAGEGTIRRRLLLGHSMIAAFAGNRIAGAICFVETSQDPHDRVNFPKTFAAYSSMARSVPVLSLYVYNLGVRPEFRGTAMARRLLSEMTEHGRRAGARWLVGDGRCPSYAGAQDGTPDKVVSDRKFRQTIEDWHRTGRNRDAGTEKANRPISKPGYRKDSISNDKETKFQSIFYSSILKFFILTFF